MLALVVAVLLVVAWQAQKQRTSWSDDIFPEPGSDGAPAFGLVADLERAEVVVPDRPHNLDEVPTLELKKEFTRNRKFVLSTNQLGLRAPEPANGEDIAQITSPAPGFRVVCLGASITFGWGVAYEESYPAQLAQALGVEVINAGAPAGDPQTLADWARENLADLDPDLVIFNVRLPYMDGDPARGLQRAVNMVAQAVDPVPVGVVLPPLSTFDLQLEDIFRLYPHAWQGHGDGAMVVEADVARTREALAPVPVLGLTATFRAAQEAYVPTDARETAVVFDRAGNQQRMLTLPDRQVWMSFQAPREGIAQGFLVAFEEDRLVHEPYFFDGGHPDEAGYALYARTVADWIRQQGWLTRP